MSPSVVGALVGILLALANFVASIAMSSIALRFSKSMSIAFVLGAFFGRLAFIFLAFYLMAQTTRIDLSSSLLSFVVCFTVLLVCEVMVYYRKAQATGKAAPRRG